MISSGGWANKVFSVQSVHMLSMTVVKMLFWLLVLTKYSFEVYFAKGITCGIRQQEPENSVTATSSPVYVPSDAVHIFMH